MRALQQLLYYVRSLVEQEISLFVVMWLSFCRLDFPGLRPCKWSWKTMQGRLNAACVYSKQWWGTPGCKYIHLARIYQ